MFEQLREFMIKTPTAARIFARARARVPVWILAQLCVAISFLTTSANCQELTAADILRRLKHSAPELRAAHSELRVLAAREASETHPNPELSVTREHIVGTPEASEDTLALSVPLDLSGRRRARSALARAQTQTAAADTARLGTALSLRALRTFYRGLAARKRAELARTLVARLEEASRVSKSRLSQGSASGYDVSRIELDVDLSRSAVSSAQAAERRAVAELSTLLGLSPDGVRLAGSLRATAMASKDRPARPSLARQRAALDAARRARSSASSAWVPQLAVDAGVRRATDQGTRYGYVAGLRVELPIFSRGSALRAEADATVEHSAARLRALDARSRSERAVATVELSSALAELERFGRVTARHRARTLRAARSAYREGQLGVTELLDAERAALRVEERLLELQVSAKLAELALRAARGEFE